MKILKKDDTQSMFFKVDKDLYLETKKAIDYLKANGFDINMTDALKSSMRDIIKMKDKIKYKK